MDAKEAVAQDQEGPAVTQYAQGPGDRTIGLIKLAPTHV
jgi:hypothetical protein